MSEETKEIRTDVAKIYADSFGIIVIEMFEGAKLDEIDVININLAIRQISGHNPVLKLLDSSKSWSMNAKAKKAAERFNEESKTIARAILVSNTLKSTLYSFLSKFDNKTSPQKFFTSERDAKTWLLNFK